MLKFLHVLFLVLSLLSTNLWASDKATEIFKSTMKKAGNPVVDYKSSCTSCIEANHAKPKIRLDSKENKKTVELTLLSEKDVDAIFKEMVANKEIPFGFPFDGCYARAHSMVQLLEKKGIISGKAWVEGNLKVDSEEFGEIEWHYHVAPVVMVKVGNKNVPYVLDPSIMDKPVPFETWKNKMTSKKGTFKSSEYFTNRFAYGPDEKNDDIDSYDDEINQDAEQTNQKYNQMLAMYRKQKQAK